MKMLVGWKLTRCWLNSKKVHVSSWYWFMMVTLSWIVSKLKGTTCRKHWAWCWSVVHISQSWSTWTCCTCTCAVTRALTTPISVPSCGSSRITCRWIESDDHSNWPHFSFVCSMVCVEWTLDLLQWRFVQSIRAEKQSTSATWKFIGGRIALNRLQNNEHFNASIVSVSSCANCQCHHKPMRQSIICPSQILHTELEDRDF